VAPRGPNQGGKSLIESSVPEKPRERMHLVLQEAEERYKHELLDDEERLRLHDRIIRLKMKLAAELAR
jgi:hypothetical protein